MVLSSWLRFIVCSSGSRDERRTAPDGCRPLDQAQDFSYMPACQLLGNHIHHRRLLLLSPKADTHFTISQRVEGWIDMAGYVSRRFSCPQAELSFQDPDQDQDFENKI